MPELGFVLGFQSPRLLPTHLGALGEHAHGCVAGIVLGVVAITLFILVICIIVISIISIGRNIFRLAEVPLCHFIGSNNSIFSIRSIFSWRICPIHTRCCPLPLPKRPNSLALRQRHVHARHHAANCTALQACRHPG